ncbi:SRPBCC family protein [Pseudonocardia sp.]|uniref:SRPBCC family protein n=1 Tax=Pseudonocardia sp. TaxID=60912 RepID=UPI003D1073E6
MIDATHQISAVRRSLGSRTLEAGEARVQTIAQVYPSDLDDVWDACTNPERLPRWFAPVTGELRLGGRYQVEGNAAGVVERCDPPKGFAATWEFGGQVSWIEVTLEPVADGTRLTLEHVAHVPDEFWTRYGPGATGVGWDLAFLGLATHLATGESAAAEGQEWAISPDGVAFATASSAAWEAVSVEAGADPEAARAAGARTTAFYTGAPEEG